MSYFSQQHATTGKKIRPSRVDWINAQTPNIYGMMALEDQRKAQEQAEANAAQNQANIDRQFLLDWKTGHEGRKDENRAKNVGYGKIAADLYFKNRGNTGINDILNNTSQTSIQNIGTAGDVASSPDMSEFSTGATSTGSSVGSKVWDSGKNLLKDFGNKITQPSTLLGGGIGGAMSNLYGGKNKWSKAGIGAGVGAASQWLLGGGLENMITGAGAATDWYSTALAGGLGGALSFF